MPSWSHDLVARRLSGAYLRDYHKNRLEQQGKLEVSTQPEKTPSDIGNQSDGMRLQRVLQVAVPESGLTELHKCHEKNLSSP